MALENKPEIQTWDLDPWDSDPWDFYSKETAFELVLDAACDRLWDKHVKYSLKRITEMERKLNLLEKELDDFLGKGAPSGYGHE